MSTLIATFARNRFGALLIVVQVALTLAIVTNAAIVVREQLARMSQPSGMDDANLFTLLNRWVGPTPDSRARVLRDVDLLRSTPGVVDAVSTNGVPLSGRGWGTVLDREPISPDRMARAHRGTLYYLDDHGMNALGLSLQSGRWFTPEEVDATNTPDGQLLVVLSEGAANLLYPEGDAVGKPVYFYGEKPSVIVGVVRRMRGPDATAINGQGNDVVVIMPQRMAMPVYNNYIVRTRPGALVPTMLEAERRLRAEYPLRVISEKRSFDETRAKSFRRFKALGIVLTAVSALLLAVTALGIVGLTSYWVNQRRRSIGVRRALGARRGDIVGQFQIESVSMAGLGILLGILLTSALNLWLAQRFSVPRLSAPQIGIGAACVLVLMQLAALLPALRAALVPPTVATRSA